MRAITAGVLFIALGWFMAPAASAQQTAGISGVAKDSSGGVLPGVTVEAASPALLEKVRSAISDNEGRYTIIDIPPGTYTVTFTLTGFSSFRREGIELSSGFTASVDATMRIGAERCEARAGTPHR